jgi:hypothetical protein
VAEWGAVAFRGLPFVKRPKQSLSRSEPIGIVDFTEGQLDGLSEGHPAGLTSGSLHQQVSTTYGFALSTRKVGVQGDKRRKEMRLRCSRAVRQGMVDDHELIWSQLATALGIS